MNIDWHGCCLMGATRRISIKSLIDTGGDRHKTPGDSDRTFSRAFDITRRCARFGEHRNDGFVEFDFSIGECEANRSRRR
ncbi:phenol hydroxylase subunit [Caballeronia sp. J97]|uniref:phenol hydroxylase subunit n=1 Tax=Caballeronia sp. J97 TaxID=2805429 RepID=UPI002AAF8669|nr:phenol hydroxylase subunit [Caballeronia sp. J97]